MDNNENKVIVFEHSVNNIKLLENDPDTSIVELQLLHTGLNTNNYIIPKQAVIDSICTFYDKPIIYRLNNKSIPKFSTDVTTHSVYEVDNYDIKDSTMNIAGQIPSQSRMEFVKYKNEEALLCDGIIHNRYQPILMKILKSVNGNMKISIEIVSLDEEVNEDGIIVINKFRLTGVCLLGTGIEEGIEDSHLEVLKFSKEKYNNSYNTFFKKNSFLIPDEVKLFAKSGLEKRKKNGKGGYSSSIAMASYLVNNNYIDLGKLNKINHYFEKHDNELDNINFALFGGNCAKEWVNVVLNANENINEKNKKEELGMDEKEKLELDKEKMKKDIEEDEKDIGDDSRDKKDEKIDDDIDKDVEDIKDDEDDIDDVDDDEKKYNSEIEKVKMELNSLKEQLASSNEIVKAYAREKEVVKQNELIAEYAHCYSKEEMEAFSNSVESCNFAETEKKVMDAVMKFAKNAKETVEAEEEIKFSFNGFALNKGYQFAEANGQEVDNLSKFLNKNMVKLNSK